MALKIVTGGTTGAADGTLVSSSNKIVFTALDTVIDCHIRADDDTYSADASFSMPSDGAVQVSYDGGSTWKAFANNPASYGVDIGDLNVAIKLRQHANATASTGTFQTDATFNAATALADVTGFTVTPGDRQNALSWSAVTNRTAYRIDRALDSGFTSGVALNISPGQTSTSFTDTGRTTGTTYYYRIKAVGTYRYKDSASYATGNGTPTYATMILADSALQSYWKCIEASGNLTDSKGGLTATASGSPTYANAGYGSLGNAVKGDGSAAYFDAGNNYAFTNASFSVECWVKRGAGNKNRVISKYEESTYGGWQVGFDGGTSGSTLHLLAQRWYPGAGTTDITGGTVLTNGVWYHVVFTFDVSTGVAKLYLNGALDATVTLSTGTLTAHGRGLKFLASNNGASANLFNDSTLQHVAIYNAVLAATPIADHYAAAA